MVVRWDELIPLQVCAFGSNKVVNFLSLFHQGITYLVWLQRGRLFRSLHPLSRIFPKARQDPDITSWWWWKKMVKREEGESKKKKRHEKEVTESWSSNWLLSLREPRGRKTGWRYAAEEPRNAGIIKAVFRASSPIFPQRSAHSCVHYSRSSSLRRPERGLCLIAPFRQRCMEEGGRGI